MENVNGNPAAQWQEKIDRWTPRLRAALRRLADGGGSIPVHVIAGGSEPSLVGEPGYYTTKSGKTVVRHPGAYRYFTRYWASTRRVQVGAEWLWERWSDVMVYAEDEREDGRPLVSLMDERMANRVESLCAEREAKRRAVANRQSFAGLPAEGWARRSFAPLPAAMFYLAGEPLPAWHSSQSATYEEYCDKLRARAAEWGR